MRKRRMHSATFPKLKPYQHHMEHVQPQLIMMKGMKKNDFNFMDSKPPNSKCTSEDKDKQCNICGKSFTEKQI